MPRDCCHRLICGWRSASSVSHLLQVIEAAEERQVIARAFTELASDQLDDRRQRRLPMTKRVEID
jgi:hypothetical protein